MKVSVGRVLGSIVALMIFGSAPSQAQPASTYSSTNAFGGLTFAKPVCIASPPGETNRLFILEKGGVIAVVTNLANPTRTVFMDISDRVNASEGELGLLGLAFHPQYASNRRFYVFYTGTATTATPGGTDSLHDILACYLTSATDPNQGDRDSEQRLIRQYDEASNHNGGDLHFGPDNYLYVSVGDEGGANDSGNNSQRIDKDFFSGILRIDVDKLPGSLAPNPHPASTTNYAIPSDNPFIGRNSFNGASVNPSTIRTEFWAVGLRNPWRFSFDPPTGYLYCGDVGQEEREEINLIFKGENYGWPYVEGTRSGPKFPPFSFSSIGPFVEYWHNSSGGDCITGGVVYRGNRFLDLVGYYVYADFISGTVWSVFHDASSTNPTPRGLLIDKGISSFGTDPSNGDILYADYSEGVIKRIVNEFPTGSLQVTIDPPGAVNDGAQWRVSGGMYRDSGVTLNSWPPGLYEITYKTISGWNAPAPQWLWVQSSSTSVTNGTYIAREWVKPTLTITSPTNGQHFSHGVFINGTASDNAAVTAVYYRLNNFDWWTAATTNNWTNWTADPSYAMNMGENVVRAYAIDADGNISATNKVTFVNAPLGLLTVSIEGSGTVSPNYNGQWLKVGKRYTVTARPTSGFVFEHWIGDGGINGRTDERLSFVMPLEIHLTATFRDVQRPTLIVTFPSVGQRVTNATVKLTGKAKDNSGVSNIWYQMNDQGWNSAVLTTNGFTNWTTSAVLTPMSGSNVVQVAAYDAQYNSSLTSKVKFFYTPVPSADWAPDSVSGLVGQIAWDANRRVSLSFDDTRFAQTEETNADVQLGNYVYYKLGTNLAQLSTGTANAPPAHTSHPYQQLTVLFTNHYSGVFTNWNGESGAISLAIATNVVPASLAKKIIGHSSDSTNTVTLSFSDHGTFSMKPSNTGTGTASSGNFTFQRHSPIAALVVLAFTGVDAGSVTYAQLTFTAKTSGSYVTSAYDSGGNPRNVDSGTFTLQNF